MTAVGYLKTHEKSSCFGCEACAVMESGRSNTRQLMITPRTMPALRRLREEMVALHAEKFGTADDLYIGLQLTHSGRYSKPEGKPAPLIGWNNPYLEGDKPLASS